MLVRQSLEVEDISHTVTLVPRLEYSLNLLDDIVNTLSQKRDNIAETNKELIFDLDGTDKILLDALKLEQTVTLSIETLLQIKKRTSQITHVSNIPEILPSFIPVIRTLSAQLYGIIPTCSQKLSELSVHLGSIVVDSAVLAKARFNFGQCNQESTTLLDKVKLIVDSKLSKQYPNLDFPKLYNA